MKNEDQYEHVEKKINFILELKMNSNGTLFLDYRGATSEDDRLVSMKKYGSGAHNIDFRSNKSIININNLNTFFKSLKNK